MKDLTFPYPTELTQKAWDKNKGMLAKIAVGKTDLGKSLDALEQAYKSSGFFKIAPFTGFDPLDFADFVHESIENLKGDAKAINVKLSSVKDACEKTIPLIESSSMPKSTISKTVAYVNKVKDSANSYGTQISKCHIVIMPKLKTEFGHHLKTNHLILSLVAAAETNANTFRSISEMITAVRETPTIETFKTVFKGNGPHRQLTTIFKTWDQMTKPVARTATKIYPGSFMKDFFPLPCLKEVGNESNFEASKKLEDLVSKGQDEATVVKNYLKLYEKSVTKASQCMDHFKKLVKLIQSF